MKGAADGGLDVPHNEKRFPGYDRDTKSYDVSKACVTCSSHSDERRVRKGEGSRTDLTCEMMPFSQLSRVSSVQVEDVGDSRISRICASVSLRLLFIPPPPPAPPPSQVARIAFSYPWSLHTPSSVLQRYT